MIMKVDAKTKRKVLAKSSLCKGDVVVFVRWDRVCFALVWLFVVSSAGCDVRSELGQGRGVSGGDQAQRPVEAMSRSSGPSLEKPAVDVSVDLPTSTIGSAGGVSSVPDADSELESAIPMFYTVAVYDVDRDPAVDLSMTISKAQQQQKRILLQVGGDWCNWCGRLAEFMRKRGRVRTLLDQHFLIMKVASQSKHADAFLANYPTINAYPFVYVLSPAGELLHAQDMEELELGDGYDEEAFVDFLNAWGASGGTSGFFESNSQLRKLPSKRISDRGQGNSGGS